MVNKKKYGAEYMQNMQNDSGHVVGRFVRSAASYYFTGPILIRHNIYTVIFKFNLIKSRVRIRLGLGLRVRDRIRAFCFLSVTDMLAVTPTNRSTLGDRVFLVDMSWAWNSENCNVLDHIPATTELLKTVFYRQCFC